MEFQAALGLAQLKKVENVLLRRRYNVRYLNEGLRPYREVLRLPQYSDDVSYLSYPIVIKKPDIISRKILTYSLEQSGIETRPIFNCIPTQQPAYAHLKKKYEGLLPNAEYIGSHGFYIGCHQYLTKRDLDRIIGTFKKVLK
jgi:CDP-6-deoxy-D-xylo-4-hexulose-3-dehydrase